MPYEVTLACATSTSLLSEGLVPEERATHELEQWNA